MTNANTAPPEPTTSAKSQATYVSGGRLAIRNWVTGINSNMQIYHMKIYPIRDFVEMDGTMLLIAVPSRRIVLRDIRMSVLMAIVVMAVCLAMSKI